MTRGHVSEEQVGRISRTMALRKIARPEDVARQVVVLASPLLSGHVTGQVVTVAGGMEGRVIHNVGAPRHRKRKVAAESSSAAANTPAAAGVIAVSPWPWSQDGNRQQVHSPLAQARTAKSSVNQASQPRTGDGSSDPSTR